MNAVAKVNPNLPASVAKLAALMGREVTNELAGGVTSGFPILAYKGKVWRVRKGGEESMHVDADGNALPTVEVVLVQANPTLSKIFYEKQYEEGTNESPRCFSNDGVKPDAGVQNPISKLCANCPNNVWGSRITPAGKKSRACSDARRMAVVFAHDLYDKGEECEKFLLRVPPASLNPLKDYAEKILAPKGIPFFGIVTRIGFDPTAAHPQFTFKPARFVNDEEAEAIAALRGSEDVKRILAEAQEFPAAPAADAEHLDEGQDPSPAPSSAGVATPPAAQPATTGAAGKQKQGMRPATEEEAGLAAAPPPRNKPAAAAPPPPPPVVEGEVMAAPPPKKSKQKPAASVPPSPPVAAAAPITVEEEEAPPPASGKPPADFDNLLDSILNG